MSTFPIGRTCSVEVGTFEPFLKILVIFCTGCLFFIKMGYFLYWVVNFCTGWLFFAQRQRGYVLITHWILLQVFGFLIYQIVVNPDVQAQLHEEIDDILNNKEDGEDLSSDDLTNMPYLDQVNHAMYKLRFALCTVQLGS